VALTPHGGEAYGVPRRVPVGFHVEAVRPGPVECPGQGGRTTDGKGVLVAALAYMAAGPGLSASALTASRTSTSMAGTDSAVHAIGSVAQPLSPARPRVKSANTWARVRRRLL
jgi:hypothetical protein